MRSRIFAPEICLVLAASLLLAACSSGEGDAPERSTPVDPAARHAALDARLLEVGTRVHGFKLSPLFGKTIVEEECDIQMSRLRATKLRLDDAGREPEPGAPPRDVMAMMDAVESHLDELDRRCEAVESAIEGDAEAFGLVANRMMRVNQALTHFSKSGLPVEEQAPVRALATQLGEGMNFWHEQIANLLGGRPMDPRLVKVGRSSIADVGKKLKPYYDRLDSAYTQVKRIDNYLESIPRRMSWVRETRARIPADDPWLQEEAHKLETLDAKLETLTERAGEVRKLARERPRDAKVDAMVQELAEFMNSINRAYVVKARELKLPLPQMPRRRR